MRFCCCIPRFMDKIYRRRYLRDDNINMDDYAFLIGKRWNDPCIQKQIPRRSNVILQPRIIGELHTCVGHVNVQYIYVSIDSDGIIDSLNKE